VKVLETEGMTIHLQLNGMTVVPPPSPDRIAVVFFDVTVRAESSYGSDTLIRYFKLHAWIDSSKEASVAQVTITNVVVPAMGSKDVRLVVPVTHFTRVGSTVYVEASALALREGKAFPAMEATTVDALGLLAQLMGSGDGVPASFTPAPMTSGKGKAVPLRPPNFRPI
jgi:hypothetical protein